MAAPRNDGVFHQQNRVFGGHAHQHDQANQRGHGKAFVSHQQAHKRAIPTLLNAAPFRDLGAEFRDLIDILVVNAVEAEMMGTGPVTDLASAARAAQDLAAQGDTVIVTAGGAGLAAVGLDGAELQVAAEKVKVVSSHGAGDAFIGALAVQLAEGAGLEKACRAASQAAARHVAGL